MPVSHLGLTVSHIPSATSFYLAALQPLGYRYIGNQGDSIGLGITDADFFLCQEPNGVAVSPTHIAFAADNRPAVRDCYAAALNAGGRPSGAPNYRNDDCNCFNAAVLDLDGNTIEFIFREPCESHTKSSPSGYGMAQSRANDAQSLTSKASRTKSRAQTTLDVASAASRSMKSAAAPPIPGITRSRTEPIVSKSENGGKAIVGTLLGAAAGAAVAFAMCQSERDNAREEQIFSASSTRSKAPSLKDSRTRSNYEGSTTSKKSQRSQRPSHSTRAIEAPAYDDYTVQDAISRYKSSQRPEPQRSRTYDAIEYAPRSTTSGQSERFRMKRASTLPTNPYLLEGPPTVSSSKHTSRRGSVDDPSLKRHDSGVSMSSHRSSRRSAEGGRRSSMSQASTAKPGRGSLYESAANIPLPSTRAPSYITAADMPLPPSQAASYYSAAQIPIPPSRVYGGYTDVPGEESDGLDDMTVLPEDSISCVDFSEKPRKSKSKSGSKSSKRSEAPSDRTVRPAKPSGSRHSAQTLPVRSKEDYYSSRGGRRSILSYA